MNKGQRGVKTIALGAMFLLLGTVAKAEQSAAARYRQILGGKIYSIRYSTPAADKILTVIEGKRIDYTFIKGGSQQVPLGGFGKKTPSAFYMNGKYYQVSEENRAYMAKEDQLNNENLDPQKGWGTIRARLALPPELAVFAPKESFNKYTDFKEAAYIDSGKRIVKIKKKDCLFLYDKYESCYGDAEGGLLYKKIYYMLYDAQGKLWGAETCFWQKGLETPLQLMEIKDISVSVTEGEKNLPKGYLVYGAGLGDMNDLVNRNVVVEDYRKTSKKKGANK
ncbi:MAG: hypothetical protein MJ041_04605 [Acidaminococcaceae bacterium]|nr:hypothetical protein [Acidaminococcaceae bacterium]